MILGPLLKLARQTSDWSPTRLSRVLWDFSTNFPRQLEILQVLRLPAFEGLIPTEPRLPFRFLISDYLARGLTVEERASCFTHHYRCLSARFPPRLLRQVLLRDLTVVEMCRGGNIYSVAIGLSRREDIHRDKEGELSLKFQVDGAVVFVLAFTIVPGRVVASEAAEVLLISLIQGVKGSYSQIQLATKALHEVAPSALLVAVLRGIAEALEVREIVGVCATSQSSYTEQLSASFRDAYDKFFTELGATRTGGKFFSIPIPLQEKPLALVKKGHKKRTKQKRSFKLKIADDVRRLIRESS